MKLGVSDYGITGYRGEHLDRRGRKRQDNGENSLMRGFMILHLAKYYWDDQNKGD
jgi:hypothetical protein